MKKKYPNTKYKQNKLLESLKILILIIISIIIGLIVVITSLNNIIKKEEKISEEQSEVDIQKQKEENMKKIEADVIISKLADMEERDRMEFYFSQFVKVIEDNDYEKAYEMLYDEFKKNHFPTLNEFKEYAKKTFPKNMTVEHVNIERNGNIYVIFVNISDFLSSKENTAKEMRFVFREDSLNHFVMSFSVI